MRKLWFTALLVAVPANYAAAQVPMRQRQALQEQVMERLLQNTRVQAGLTDQQFEQFREIATRSTGARNGIQMRERALWRALEGQMRPGVAADADSVVKLIDALVGTPAQLVAQARTEQEEYAAFLSPVQRAHIMLAMRRFQGNIQQIMQRRMRERGGPQRRP